MKYTRPIHIKITDLHNEFKSIFPTLQDLQWRLFGTNKLELDSIVPFELNIVKEIHSGEYCDIVDFLISKFGNAKIIYIEINY